MNTELETWQARVAELERANAELEEELRIQQQAYATLVEDQRELICRLNPDGTLAFVNDAYCRMFNKTREELIGRHYAPLIPEADQPLIADVMARLAAKEPIVRCEHRVITPSGEVRWLNWIDRVMLDDTGELVGIQAVAIDVTDRVQAEEHLRRNAALGEQLLHAQDEALRELSAPLIPIVDNVLAMPLIGRIDEKRANVVLETLLAGVSARSAQSVLIDVTGIPSIDTQVAGALVRTARAVKLLGARVALTGIQPHVAQTLVAMQVEIHGIVTLRSLQEGIAWAMNTQAIRS